MSKQHTDKKDKFYNRVNKSIMKQWEYVSTGVWNDTRNKLSVNAIKTINLSVKSFFRSDLQSISCALTFRTILAIIPALALIFAIGRGFNVQNVIERELIHYFPAHEQMLRNSFGFVDNYLEQASSGIFVGIGIVFLFWTLVSLLSSVEKAFNQIWQVSIGRSMWRKISDYTAIFILLPVLMLTASGITLYMSNGLKYLLPETTFAPVISLLIDAAGVVLTWLFFTGSYILVPNVKVRFKNAFLAGIIVGTGYQILQWVFLSGQLYVAKYNAIYGGFSFLPLFLIWLQLVWLLTLIGGVICYSSQNINNFEFGDNIKNVSTNYSREITLIVMTIMAKRFANGEDPISVSEFSRKYAIPVNVVTPIVNRLRCIGMINFVIPNQKRQSVPQIQTNVDVCDLTVKDLMSRLNDSGESNFLPSIRHRYQPVIDTYHKILEATYAQAENIRLKDIDLTI